MLDFSDLVGALDDNPFTEEPVDVKTFVLSPDFLGLPPLSEHQYTLVECMSQIYRVEDLVRIMGEEAGRDHYKRYTKTEVILKLGKGSGKDHTSTVGCAYVVYKLLCLKDPAMYYGKPPGDAIDIINIAVNAEQAKNVFFDNFVRKIKNSPWFAGKWDAKVNSIQFDKSITVYSGHSERESHEGLNLILAILDEISAFAMQSSTASNDQAKTAENIYKAFRGSVDSRFPDLGKVLLLSFPRYKGDFISKIYDDVVATKDTIVRDHTFIINPELPEDAPDNTLTIEWEEDHIESYKLPGVFALCRPTWEVNPIRHIEEFKMAFYKDTNDALMRFACMPGHSSDSWFKDEAKLVKALSIRNPVDQYRRIDPSFGPDPTKTYYIHADLAQKNDKCAVAVSHVDKWVTVQNNKEFTQIVPFVVVDAIAWWEPRKEGPIDLSEVKNWIINLRRAGFDLGMVTFDRWQSFDIQRELTSIGIPTDTLSVARKHYDDLAMLLYEERVAAPWNEILHDELLELRLLPNGKIDHPRKGSKDLADAFCGSVYNAVAHGKREETGDVEVHDYSSFKHDTKVAETATKKPDMTPDIEEYLKSFSLI